MAENKTKQTTGSAEKYLTSVADENRRQDAFKVLTLMKRVTKEGPKMWGSSLVGFGNYHYKYESGREGDFFLTGFSPRKQNLVVYIMPGFGKYDALMKDLGKYKTGKSCLYIKRLSDIDVKILEKLIRQSVKDMKKMYGHARG